MITVSFGYPCDNKIQILKFTKALDTLSCYLFRFTIQTQREQSSQCQRTLVRLLSLSVLEYLNITLASNQNNNNAAASVSQGGEPLGSNNLYPNKDVDGMGMADTVATTQFVSDKNVVAADKILPAQLDRIVYESSSDSATQDIKTFLGKPVILLSGVFTTTDTVSTFSDINNPFDNFVTSAGMLIPKIEGFLGFRATTVYRLVVNANRFQQGRYNMSYIALGGADGTAKTNKWANDHAATLVQRTTLPHVELDLCCDTEATIRIPFNSAMNFYPLQKFTNTGLDVGTWGILNLYPYVPLSAATGNLTASFTLYSWFEDVQLVGAVVPQAGNIGFSKKTRKSVSEIEQESDNIGPISSALIKVRDASSIIGKIPLLSAYANSVSWFADIGASAAKVFGFSKPINLEASRRMTQNYLPYVASTDGPDMSFPVSLSSENAVGMANGFSGTDVDEMSFSYLATIPVWMATQAWATSAASGTLLSQYHVSPEGDTYTTVVNTATFKHLSPLQLLSEHFQQWRGSIVFKMKFVKTEFHSGRLSVSFMPYSNSVTIVAPSYGTSPFLHRQIIDIREANEFTFVVPFISDSPYKDTSGNPSGVVGNIYIHVVDPLVAPATVSQTVSIIVEKCAGPDIEFAIPRICLLNYFSGIAPQSGEAFSSVAQGSTVCSNLNTTIGSTLVSTDNSVNSLHCIGEKVDSFRTLLKKPAPMLFAAAPTLNNYLNILPFAISSGTVVTVTNTLPPVLNDLYSRIASCYVYSRGGVRIKFLDNMAVTTTTPIAVALDVRTPNSTLATDVLRWGAVNAGGTANSTDQNNMPVMYYRAGYSGEVQVPQYARYHSRVNSDCVANAVNPYGSAVNGIAPKVSLSRYTIPLSATAGSSVLRSVADDSNFGYFLSVPPMFESPSLIY